MLVSAIPTKFPIPFANSAGGSYIRPIPRASQIGTQNGAASLTDGFPPNCFVPIAAGGSWPFGQDMNGLMNQVTKWLQWNQAGGPIFYDSSFSSSIGGYPNGAILLSAASTFCWMSTVDNNTTNPDAGGAGWVTFPSGVTLSFAVLAGTGTVGPTAGSGVVVAPPGTTKILFRGCGGGGAGAGANNPGGANASTGSPGTAGSYGEGWFAYTGAPIAFSIGGGGANASGSAGGNGSNTTFGGGTCPGGPGGGLGSGSTPQVSASGAGTQSSGFNVINGVGDCSGISIAYGSVSGTGGSGGRSPFGGGCTPVNGQNANGINATFNNCGPGAGGGGSVAYNGGGPLRGGNGANGTGIVLFVT